MSESYLWYILKFLQNEKIKLQDAVMLENNEMKMVLGGSGIEGTRYSCSCNSGVVAVSWEGLYVNQAAIDASIDMNCGSGRGSCTPIS